jgi:hypothetical protein
MAALEYTDAPTSESHLPAPTAQTGLLETAEGQASDLVAVALSVIPGLGHVYKGYRVIGLLLMPIMMFGGIIVQNQTQKMADTSVYKVAVIDRTDGGTLATALLEAAKRRNEVERLQRRRSDGTRWIWRNRRVDSDSTRPAHDRIHADALR